jgi:histone acetyltransferase
MNLNGLKRSHEGDGIDTQQNLSKRASPNKLTSSTSSSSNSLANEENTKNARNASSSSISSSSSSNSNSSSSTAQSIDLNGEGLSGANSDLTFQAISNDGTDEALTSLVGLKNIFSKQLPKMPREYIVRLVFDSRHISLAIFRNGRLIGGVCYRPYPTRRFGEIAFLAISGTDQVRGYGTILMNNLKRHAQENGIEYFLTYADNFAIGYFQKQGFSKNIAMPKERWMGYIKDYDGGTLMECYIHPGFDYLSAKKIISAQRKYVYERLVERSQSHHTHKGLDLFRNGQQISCILDVPGVQEAGWTSVNLYGGSTERDRNNALNKLKDALKSLVDKLRGTECVWPLLEIGSETATATDSSKKEDRPVDLKFALNRIKNGFYRSARQLLADLLRTTAYCRVSASSSSQPEYLSAVDASELLIRELFNREFGLNSLTPVTD